MASTNAVPDAISGPEAGWQGPLTKEQTLQQALLKARKPLKDEIQKLLAAHRDDQPPPFSNEELIVMAIIDSDMQYRSHGQITKWILESFPFHKQKVFDEIVYNLEEDQDATLGCYMNCINGGLEKAFNSHEVPLIQKPWYAEYTVRAQMAQRYLRRWREPERQGVFRFLDLPPELRNRIYDMTLIFPEPVIQVSDDGWGALNLKAHGREYGLLGPSICKGEECHLERYSNCYFPIHSPNAVLNLSLTCKQLARETLPVFFGSNCFSFSSPRCMRDFTRKMTTDRLRLLKKLHIQVDWYGNVCASYDDRLRQGLEDLAKKVSLSELYINVGSGRSGRGFEHERCTHTNAPTFADVPSMFAVARLASTAKEVKIFPKSVDKHSPFSQHLCPDFKEFIAQEVSRIKAKDEPPRLEKIQDEQSGEGVGGMEDSREADKVEAQNLQEDGIDDADIEQEDVAETEGEEKDDEQEGEDGGEKTEEVKTKSKSCVVQ